MYKVTIEDTNYDLLHDYTGCVSMRISDSGTISADFYTGENKIYRMKEGDQVIKMPMTDEEIMATPGLAEWYTAALAAQEELSKKQETES